MNLTKEGICELNAMQLCRHVTRLQFDEEAGCAMVGDKEEIALIETELRKRLVKMLGRDFYPPDRAKKKELPENCITSVLVPVKPEVRPGLKIKFPVIVSNSMGTKVAEFPVEADTKIEADKMARKEIRKLGLKGATYKIS